MQSDSDRGYAVLYKFGALFLSALLIWGYGSVIFGDGAGITKGNSDFLDCYTASRILADGKAVLLYDIPTQTSYQTGILASLGSSVKFAGGVLLYSHPPFAALLYLPLARLSYAQAFVVWSIFSLCFLLLSLYLLFRNWKLRRLSRIPFILLAIVGFLPVFIAFAQGQNTFIALFFLILAVTLLKNSDEFRAGISLSLVLFKFQIVPLFLIVALIKRRWRFLYGFCLGSVSIFAITLPIFGIEGWKRYFSFFQRIPSFVDQYGFAVAAGHCLRGQLYAFLYPDHAQAAVVLTILAMLACSMVALYGWRGPWKAKEDLFDLRIAMTVIMAILIGPLINFHDLSFLILPAWLIYAYLESDRNNVVFRRFYYAGILSALYLLPIIHLTVRLPYPILLSVWGLLCGVYVLLRLINNNLFQLKGAK